MFVGKGIVSAPSCVQVEAMMGSLSRSLSKHIFIYIYRDIDIDIHTDTDFCLKRCRILCRALGVYVEPLVS